MILCDDISVYYIIVSMLWWGSTSKYFWRLHRPETRRDLYFFFTLSPGEIGSSIWRLCHISGTFWTHSMPLISGFFRSTGVDFIASKHNRILLKTGSHMKKTNNKYFYSIKISNPNLNYLRVIFVYVETIKWGVRRIE